jgi:hypothetical protein
MHQTDFIPLRNALGDETAREQFHIIGMSAECNEIHKSE